MQIYSQYYLEKKNISWYVYLCKYQKIFALKSVTNSFNLLWLRLDAMEDSLPTKVV